MPSRFGRVSPTDCSWPSVRGTASSGTYRHDNLKEGKDAEGEIMKGVKEMSGGLRRRKKKRLLV